MNPQSPSIETAHAQYCSTRNERALKKFRKISFFTSIKKVILSNPLLAVPSFMLIAAINAVIPLAILWLFFRFCCRESIKFIPESIRLPLTLWSLIEVCFLFYHFYLSRKSQKLTKMGAISESELQELMRNSMSQIKDGKSFISKWFFGRNINDITFENVAEWVSYSFYGDLRHTNDPFIKKMLSKFLKKSQLHHLVPFADENHNFNSNSSISMAKIENVHFMQPFAYPMSIFIRPFIYYFVTDTILGNLGHFILTKMLGYKYCKSGTLNYWTYFCSAQKAEEEQENEPIIFIHGIGSGILMYLPFLFEMHSQFRHSNRRIIIISIPSISMTFPSLKRLNSLASELGMESTVRSMQLIFTKYSLKSGIFMGHSFGTVFLSWILKTEASMVSKAIFIDPVCFLLYEPDVVFNFVYRKPTSVGQLFMFYFVCREFGNSCVIGRHFWWFNNVLFAEQCPEGDKTKVFLSGNDCVTNAAEVREYLERDGIGFCWEPKHVHGSVLMDSKSWRKILKWVV